jgi:hypothetical protein
MKERNVWVNLRRFALSCALAAVAAAAVSAAKTATVQVLTFSIDATANQAVFADGRNPPNGEYKDYRLTTAVTDPNYCVEASPESGGLTFIRLNRKLDGDAGYQYCGLYAIDPTNTPATPRQYALTIPAADACAELFANGYTEAAAAPCTLTGHDKPRIRLDNLYANRATSTPVSFLSEFYTDPAGISYEVRTDSAAQVSIGAGDANVRNVQYGGTAHLVKFAPGVKATQVASAFPLPFHMTFVRTGF